MTPQEAIERLMAGNERFATGQPHNPRRDPVHRKGLLSGQAPYAAIHACGDSRVPPEILFDAGLGELFVTRVAGNVLGPQVVGSVEYAVGHLHVPLVVVLGHSSCGAVAATISTLESGGPAPGSLDDLVRAIAPAVRPGMDPDEVAKANVALVVEQLRGDDAIIGPAVRSGQTRVVGMFYHMDDGRVTLLDV